jgi:hypothetical protein
MHSRKTDIRFLTSWTVGNSKIPSLYDASVLKIQGAWNKEGMREMRNTYRILHFNLLHYTVLHLHNNK